MSKTLWIVAGPNGSGKSTLVSKYESKFNDKPPFINPDDIAKAINPNYDGKDVALIAAAGRETVQKQRELLERGETFGYETTFSGNRDLKLIEEAQKQGYKVKLAFVGLNHYKDNLERVGSRVLKGGHYVAPEDIKRRYERSMENLKTALKKADQVYLFDNSGSSHKLIARIKERKLIDLLQFKEHF